MQILKRIIYFISLFFIYIITRELLELYYYVRPFIQSWDMWFWL